MLVHVKQNCAIEWDFDYKNFEFCFVIVIVFIKIVSRKSYILQI